eukprot:CAMPEP_0203962982 /NCGR_PEP_ID=MMETSP0359-20131031/93041_1 /ASSEMBLY_ACC=CAM_ASM_000338 /TAXON_ID=268821 /ORGANISM="Scrippsiella Hangoei, Strain SHTV-5" /LENGTH=30 /DNA_ID= /DNA_START= /DNA_END= /DNA_ORIENTATION=
MGHRWSMSRARAGKRAEGKLQWATQTTQSN